MAKKKSTSKNKRLAGATRKLKLGSPRASQPAPKKTKLTPTKALKNIFKPKPKSFNQKAKPPRTSWSKRRQLKRDHSSRKRSEYLASLPTGRLQRLAYRLQPKRVAGYCFSKRGLLMFLKLSGLALVIVGLSTWAVFAYYRRSLPTNIASLQACIHGQTTEYYDSTGETLLWASKSNVDCLPVTLSQVNPYLVQAVLAAEDGDFYEHNGFRSSSIIRAALNNLRGNNIQGGSTITQQYIKTAILKSPERILSRKIKELILAIELERSFTKDEILTAYLNVIPFGSVYDGIEAASRGYFNKPAAELGLDEAALLAAALPSPSYYWGNPVTHQERQHHVLGLMRAQGRINQTEYEQALTTDSLAKVVRTHNQYEDLIAPHFVLEVEKRLKDKYGYGEDVRRLGLRVITTVDLNAQTQIEAAVAAGLPGVEQRGFDNAAAVAVEVETGKVIAQQGSRDFNHPSFGQTNSATIPYSTGSTFKIFDYGALIEHTTNWGAGSIFYDYRTTFAPGYTPRNYSGQHSGPLTMRQVLGQSLNIPAIKAMYIAGIDRVHEFARLSGIRTAPNCGGYCGLSTAIGGGNDLRLDELTNAYATFSRGGQYSELIYVDKVYSSEGDLLHRWQLSSEQVFNPQTAYILNNILSDSRARFAPTLFNTRGVTTAVKTGTTDFFKDNLIVGYSKTVALGVWFGHHDRSRKVYGEPFTNPVKATIFRNFMEAYHQGRGADQTSRWQAPAGIKQIRLDRIAGYQTNQTDEEKSVVDIFPSWYIPKRQTEEQTVAIDLVSEKRATECTPKRAQEEISGGTILAELPLSDPYYQTWLAPIIKELGTVVGGGIPVEEDDIHQCDDLPPAIEIINPPTACLQICLLTVDVRQGSFPLQAVNFLINGNLLPGGSLPVSADGRISYSYQPSFSVRDEILIEVVDEALYDAHLTIEMDFTAAEPLVLNEVIVIGQGTALQFTWNRPTQNLNLYFGGDCAELVPINLPYPDTSEIVSSTEFPRGTCSAYLQTPGLASNSQEFILIRDRVLEPEPGGEN